MRTQFWALLAMPALLAAACGAGGAATAPTMPSPTPASASPGQSRPPAASAISGSATAALGIGSYCWSEPGKTGVCVDSIGPVTSTQALPVTAGATVTVANPVAGSPVKSATITAWSGLNSRSTQGSEQVWLLNGGASQTLASTLSARGIEFTAALAPGTYVIDIGLTYAQGGVSYGLLLDVR